MPLAKEDEPLIIEDTIGSIAVNESQKAALNHQQRYENIAGDRFELELEFIQCLASPAYLHHLATQGYFQDASFLRFLQYLKYWKHPDYAKFIIYPHGLYFLDLLCGSEAFRREMGDVRFRNFVHEQQFYTWQYRSRHLYGCGLTTNDDVLDDNENK
mmetsp:Transcript_212/g.318  ORF Transcript_212/g.318 Transcript_212/m.318 type:complete len:157 (+) Transcript_212:73-543(+)